MIATANRAAVFARQALPTEAQRTEAAKEAVDAAHELAELLLAAGLSDLGMEAAALAMKITTALQGSNGKESGKPWRADDE